MCSFWKRSAETESGMTLMEMLAAILVLTLLVTAMGTGMDGAMEVYGASLFETDSAMLARILNEAMTDVLRFAQIQIREDGEIVLRYEKYGLMEGILGESEGKIVLQTENGVQLLANPGVYGDLSVQAFRLEYIPEMDAAGRHGFWYACYEITDGMRVRNAEISVRPMNAPRKTKNKP